MKTGNEYTQYEYDTPTTESPVQIIITNNLPKLVKTEIIYDERFKLYRINIIKKRKGAK